MHPWSGSLGSMTLTKAMDTRSKYKLEHKDAKSEDCPPLLHVELARVITFSKWPYFENVWASDLASAGFYYKVQTDETICFFCLLTIPGKDWQKYWSPLVVHAHRNPSCDFVLNKDHAEGNAVHIAYTEQGLPEPKQAPATRRYFPEQPDCGMESVVSPLFRLQQPQSIGTDAPGNPNRRNTPFHPQLPRLSGSDDATRTDSHFMQNFDNRLSSFSRWPSSHIVSPTRLAEAGFFYLGDLDRVRCAFCDRVARHWEQGDDPLTEHVRLFPECPFLTNRTPSIQAPVPMTPLAQTQSLAYPQTTQVYTMHQSLSQHQKPPAALPVHQNVQAPNPMTSSASFPPRSESAGSLANTPRYPEYTDPASRLQTFNGWPACNVIAKEMLCNAGFFYTGELDSVRCHQCGGGLHNWEQGDDPYMEHARWFPKCIYIRQVKGEAFVRNMAAQNRSESSTARPAIAAPRPAVPALTRPAASVMNDPLTAALSTNTVKNILDMGFPRELVKKAIQSNLERFKRRVTPADLLEMVFRQEESTRSGSSGELPAATAPHYNDSSQSRYHSAEEGRANVAAAVNTSRDAAAFNTAVQVQASAAGAVAAGIDSSPQLTTRSKRKKKKVPTATLR